jgi:hypothetical protein
MAKSTTSSWKVSVSSYTDKQSGREYPTLGVWIANHPTATKARPLAFGRLKWEVLMAFMSIKANRDKVQKWLASQARKEAAAHVAANKSAEQTGSHPDVDSIRKELAKLQKALAAMADDVVEDDDDEEDDTALLDA